MRKLKLLLEEEEEMLNRILVGGIMAAIWLNAQYCFCSENGLAPFIYTIPIALTMFLAICDNMGFVTLS